METILTTDTVYKKTTSVQLAMLFIVCFAGNMFAGVVSTLMSVYLPVVVKELRGSQTDSQFNEMSAYINSIFIFGWAAGGFLWGFIGDKAGRKISLLLSIACFGIFTLLISQATQWWQIVVCRFLSGVGTGGLLVISFTLISEVWPEKTRAVYTGILSISIPVGIFSAGAINYLVNSWRQGFMVGVIPIAVAIVGFWVISESGLWLKDHEEHINDNSQDIGLFHRSNLKTLLIGSVIFGTMLIGLWAIFLWLPTWIQSLLTTDANKERGISMMFMGMGGLTGGFISGWVVNLLGLRRSLILSFVVCSVVSFILFKTNATFSGIIYIEIAFLALFFGISQGVLSLYIPLLFPTSIRASATGFCFNIGRIFTGIAVLGVGVLVTTLGGYSNSLFTFSLVFVIGLIAMLMIKDIQNGTQSLKK
ncbi:MFS transporter [Mucilaginibacter sp. BT774]|uniref:MFS transporter n=1 Tax=Mucilaginibacter sp. BT774 TaxID=3062276 RepID=UPI002677564B|nr:MFS transporter [Mucilaginibacter sp. BT774]MDO3628038.1 MFS transporter [Mucilaginibacter sp. BT774]